MNVHGNMAKDTPNNAFATDFAEDTEEKSVAFLDVQVAAPVSRG